MAGVGKTTLAQLLYNDPKVEKHFAMKGWVSVSQNFDVIRLVKAAIESFTLEPCELTQLSSLQSKAVNLVERKKVLLVMDDIWCTDMDEWGKFVAPITRAQKGSKILITTRRGEVAETIGDGNSFELETLSEDDGWTLLQKHTFGKRASEDVELKEIGKGIVNKCGGLPLAIKVLAGLLRSKGCEEDRWRHVLESNLLDVREAEADGKILGSLYLSYMHLSSELKTCFKCCCIYPRGSIRISDLKRYWMAYDLVKDDEEAQARLEELESRFFLKLQGDEIVVHDLIYDLAQHVSGEEHSALDYKTGVGSSGSSPHASLQFLVDGEDREINIRHKNLRTLYVNILADNTCPKICISAEIRLRVLYMDPFYSRQSEFSVDSSHALKHSLRILRVGTALTKPPQWIFQLYNLRDLDLSYTNISELPYDVGNLKNLQWMNLGNTKIITLPESISKLVNLQDLNLHGCVDLKKLPQGICNLTNLRSLNVKKTLVSDMPRGFGRLTKLQYIMDFFVSSQHGEAASLAELKDLVYLKKLVVHDLGGVVGENEAKEAEMANKKRLRELSLHSFRDCGLQYMKPHHKLEKLSISTYKGMELPSWMGDGSFEKLVSLQLSWIDNCAFLSPVDQLPSLMLLQIKEMNSLAELFSKQSSGKNDGDVMHPETEQRLSFPKLEQLYIFRCGRLKSLPLYKFPSLKEVQVEACPSLQSMEPPYNINSSLASIQIKSCVKFHFSPDHCSPSPPWKLEVVYMPPLSE